MNPLPARETYDVCPGVGGGEDIACIGGGHFKVRDDCNGLDLLGPGEFPIMTNSKRRLWGLFTGIDATSRGGEDLTQRNLFTGNILRLQLVQVGSNETTEKGGSNIIRVPLLWSNQPKGFRNKPRQLTHQSLGSNPVTDLCSNQDGRLHSPASRRPRLPCRTSPGRDPAGWG